MSRLTQKIRFVSVDDRTLADILGLDRSLTVRLGETHRQLAYVQKYVRELDCRSVVVEEHYIDRDYMEDHSIFYSKNLYPYPNFCRRVHFFNCELSQLRSELRGLRRDHGGDRERFVRTCAEFSENRYLGFSVIKPLPGCPVGRTVLRCFPAIKNEQYRRRFDCACDYEAHLLGLPLRVRGLAFQQQDRGVSACATTAIWSSLQRARDLEASGAATPAQITLRASQFALPFGRAMPSEGLSVDQMCQAVRSLGFAPNLFRGQTFEVSRDLLYSSILSGISPVLILDRFPDRSSHHAVAVVGMKVDTTSASSRDLDDQARELAGIYLHDDRAGPYLRADIRKHRKHPLVHIPHEFGQEEDWMLSHILIPMHEKIRLSFGELRSAAINAAKEVHIHRDKIGARRAPVSWQSRIVRSQSYLESMLFGDGGGDHKLVEKLCSSVRFSRYLGIVKVEGKDFDPIHIILDTTSTERNLDSIAVVQTSSSRGNTETIARRLSEFYDCRHVF